MTTEDEAKAKLRRRKIALIHRMAREGNPIARFYSPSLLNRDPDHQDAVLAELASVWERTRVAARKIYTGAQESIGRETGMTLEDFVWLKNYESCRRADGLAQGGEGE